MDHGDKPQPAPFDASLPLPGSDSTAKKDEGQDLAAELIRKKVAAAYADEPDIDAEASELEQLGGAIRSSKHQAFIERLMASGKPLHDIQTDWHEYYQGLSDLEKHEVWQEFYSVQSQSSRFSAAVPTMAPKTDTTKPPAKKRPASRPQAATAPEALDEIRKAAVAKLRNRSGFSLRDNLQSLAFGLSTGLVVLAILLFSFFNDRFIAPLIQPSRQVSNIPLITSGSAVGDKPEIIIPKINVEIPVVYGVNTIDDNEVERALEDGVVHYADTAMPGQNGNLVIVGHSSNNIFNPGKYKFAFVLLSKLDSGDTFYIQKDGKRYTYQVYQKKIVGPDDVSVLGPTEKTATATLITCDPPGTSINRLVVTAEQISPEVASNAPASGSNAIATSAKVVPGNAPSLWSRLWSWL